MAIAAGGVVAAADGIRGALTGCGEDGTRATRCLFRQDGSELKHAASATNAMHLPTCRIVDSTKA